jgi:hypothetical protein
MRVVQIDEGEKKITFLEEHLAYEVSEVSGRTLFS